jgi:rhomboid protease GluP
MVESVTAPPSPRLPTPWLTIGVGVLLVAAFVASMSAGVAVMDATAQSLLRVGGNFAPLTLDGEPWRLGSSMFLHGGLMHLVMNLIGLASGGLLVERLYGRLGMTLVYVLAGLAGGLASALAHPMTVAIGASGAIFGLFGAIGAYFIAHRRQLDAGIYRAQLKQLGIFVGINLLFGLSQPRIDLAAHAGGLGAGFALGLLLEWGTPPAFAADRIPRGRRQLVVAAVASVVLGLGVASAGPRGPSPVAYQAAIDRLGRVEAQVRTRFVELGAASDAGTLPADAFARQVTDEVIAPWRAGRDAHAAVEPPASMRALHQALRDYGDALERMFQASIAATSGSAEAAAAFDAAIQAVDGAELEFVIAAERLRGPAAGAEQRAVDKLQAAALELCDAGDGNTCWNLAEQLRAGFRGRAPQPERATELVGKACDHGVAGACVELGLRYETGAPAAAIDLPRAASYYERGCTGGDPYGCFDLGLLLEHGRGVPRDRTRAIALYQRACERDLADACFNAGLLLDNGGVLRSDDEAARAGTSLERACTLGQRLGCVEAAKLQQQALPAGPPGEDATSPSLTRLRSYCDEGEGYACAVLGDVYAFAWGVRRDRTRAAEFGARACKAGYLESCPPSPP